jgi:hypothetical protein
VPVAGTRVRLIAGKRLSQWKRDRPIEIIGEIGAGLPDVNAFTPGGGAAGRATRA